MGYESPIWIAARDLHRSIMKEQDDYIFETVEKTLECKVDREELLKALAYDRDQYDKGFRDGRRSAKVEAAWTEENTCSHCGEEACAGYDEEPWRTRYCPHCGAKMKNPEEYE